MQTAQRDHSYQAPMVCSVEPIHRSYDAIVWSKYIECLFKDLMPSFGHGWPAHKVVNPKLPEQHYRLLVMML